MWSGMNIMLKGQCNEIFDFWFFSWISFPEAFEYTITVISNFFENSRRYSRLKVHHRCQRHRWQMEKIFKQKNFYNFVWAPLGSRGNIYVNFCLQVHFKVSAAWYCSHSNLLAVSLIRRSWHRQQICRRYRWHRWQICHRCQQHKGNWWQNLPPVSLIPVANLPPVSLIPATICHQCYWVLTPVANLPPVLLTPVVHLDLRKSRQIFKKIQKDPTVIFRGLGEGDSWKKPKAKNLVTLSLAWL